MDTFFQEYGLMDPELSTAWDEEHGLKPKQIQTASVSKFISSYLILIVMTLSHRQIQCYSGEITVMSWHWMRFCSLRDEVCMRIHPVVNVQPFVPSITARIASAASYIVRNVLWQLVFESPVRSGFWGPRVMDRNRNRSS
jgi:hypothetical protein